jgi:curved DNA-binding protein CbpA
MPQDFYEILEVQPDADVALIKSQYRKLVRENHPDIAPDKEAAHARMQLILEAYNTLSDAEKRTAYDRVRKGESEPAKTTARPAQARPSSSPRPGSSSYAPRPNSSGYAPRNTSRSSSSRGSSSGSSSRSSSSSSSNDWSNVPAASSSNPRTRLLTMVFEAANLYFEDGRAQEAISICERVMKADASNAEAPALLGDIYADQGRIDLALMMYERAMRRRPDNLGYRQKYEALKNTGGAGPSPTSTPRTTKTQSTKTGGCLASVLFWGVLTIAGSYAIFCFIQP